MRPPRVAFFPDSFHEVNGVAHTSRNFVSYAERHHLPFLCIRAAPHTSLTPASTHCSGNLHTLELTRSAASVGLEKDLSFDPLFWRHADRIEAELHRFQPDLLHLTGPSELGIFAAYFAWKLNLPLAASWHTNVHEYAATRLTFLLSRLPYGTLLSRSIEAAALRITTRFYRLAELLFAPNLELCDMLTAATGRPCHLMQRGVDTELFSPAHRTRPHPHPGPPGTPFLLGYVGRLSIEKNVALLPLIQHELTARGIPVRFLIIGHGAEEAPLRRLLPDAVFTGVLRGLDLARAYSNMDLLVFPSHTDTFGNVVLEALASGVPAIVTPHGGPKFIIGPDQQSSDGESSNGASSNGASSNGERGAIAPDPDFASAIADILNQPERLSRMRSAARAYALTCSWDAVFDRVYSAYRLLDRDRLTGGGSTTVSNPR